MRRLIVLAVLVGAMGAFAAPDAALSAQGNARNGASAVELSADQAAAIAQQATGGRVLSAQLMRRDDVPVYRVKVLTPQGVVRVVFVDARTGALH